MQTVGAIVYFFQKTVHMSASLRNGGGVFLHLPFFDKYTHQPCVFPSPSPSFPSPIHAPSLVFTLPLLKCEMRGGSQDNWPCVSWVV